MSNFDDGAEEARLEASKTCSQNRESRSNFFHALCSSSSILSSTTTLLACTASFVRRSFILPPRIL
jgi:hypothetical protein